MNLLTPDKSENYLSKKDIWTPVLFAMAIVIGMLAGMRLKNEPLVANAPKKTDTKTEVSDIIGQGRMEEILRYVDAKYVDDVNDDFLIDHSINNLLNELDPHSVFIPSNDLKHVNEDLEGEFDGVGIDALILDDTLTVVSPYNNGPAANNGILPDDKIIEIDDSSTIGKNMRWVNKALRGKKGTTVNLKILRGGNRKLKEFIITRDKIPVHSVEASTVMDEATGYIKIARFSNNTTREFLQGLEKLFEKKGVKNLIIDLRQNPGGYLDKAVDVLSQVFSDKDKLLVYTKGRTVHRNEYKTTGRNRYDVGKIAVLIDEGSASASEIVAGAIQDWDRGVVIGRRSFGKGLVQEPYQLKDGSELRLTVARYFTPTGRSIQKPYKNKTPKQYEDEEEKRFERGELTKDGETQADTARFFTASGRVVFGGGGIRPDYFVPIDPTVKNEYFTALKLWIPEYAYRYYNQNRREFSFNEWQTYQRAFRITDNIYSDFLRYAEKQGVRRDNLQSTIIKDLVKKQLKARIARLVYGEEGYYGVLNDYDPCVQQAMDILKRNDPLGLKRIVRK
jgi:carboxyl-terminal processing protease